MRNYTSASNADRGGLTESLTQILTKGAQYEIVKPRFAYFILGDPGVNEIGFKVSWSNGPLVQGLPTFIASLEAFDILIEGRYLGERFELYDASLAKGMDRRVFPQWLS